MSSKACHRFEMTIKTTCFQNNFTWDFIIMGHRGQYYLRSHIVTCPHLLQYNLEMWAGQSTLFCFLWQMKKWVKAGKCCPYNHSASDGEWGQEPRFLACHTVGLQWPPLPVTTHHVQHGNHPRLCPASSSGASVSMSCKRRFPLALNLFPFPPSPLPWLACWRFPCPSSLTSHSPTRSIQAPHLTDELGKMKLSSLKLNSSHTFRVNHRDIWDETLSSSQKKVIGHPKS